MPLFKLTHRIAQRPLAKLTVGIAALAMALAGCGSSGGSSGGGGGGGGSSVNPGPAPQAGTTSSGGCDPTYSGTDPLVTYQWYLNNGGGVADRAFASTSGSANQDINFNSLTGNGCGVKVAIVDEGLEIAHEDLADNVVDGASVRFNSSPKGSNPTNTSTVGDHGTSVAGLIAMRGNTIGGRGIASAASIVGYNFLQSATDANELIAMGGSPYTMDTMVFNMSYGLTNNFPITIGDVNPAAEDAYEDGVTLLRDSGDGALGAIYVKSAGNGFDGYSGWLCGDSSVTCQNANMDPYNTLPYIVVVGATNAGGYKSSYSTAGSALWVSAPGGEYGYDATYGWGGPAEGFMPAMLTTDQSGCNKGYSRSDEHGPNRFSDNSNGLNPGCHYTTNFNGTSSAAPVTSGVVALILQANPGFTWRDVKHILAVTATNDTDTDGAFMNTFTPIQQLGVDIEPDWRDVPGGLSLRFHNWYGFGRVNAGEAVTLAGTYEANTWEPLTNTGWLTVSTPTTINDNNATGITQAQVVTAPEIDFVEAVQVMVNIAHAYAADLQIELTYGSTTSVLLNWGNGFGSNNYANGDNLVLSTNAFYGADPNGTWTLRIRDLESPDQGTLQSWAIRIYGHNVP